MFVVGLYYEEQKEPAIERAKDFREQRIPKFFKHFEAVLHANEKSDGKWLYGSELTYADLALFHLVEGVSDSHFSEDGGRLNVGILHSFFTRSLEQLIAS